MIHGSVRRVCMMTIVTLALLAPSVQAGERFELTPFFGFRFSGSIDDIGTPFISKLDIKDSEAYGLTVGFNLTENAQIELLWSRQNSELRVQSTKPPDEEFDLDVDHFHIGTAYMLGDSDFRVRPFVAFSVGATYFDAMSRGSETRFSFSLGGGLKWFTNGGHLGLRLQGRWIPTYINSSSEGYFCNAFGCFTVTDSNYLNEVELSLGLIISL